MNITTEMKMRWRNLYKKLEQGAEYRYNPYDNLPWSDILVLNSYIEEQEEKEEEGEDYDAQQSDGNGRGDIFGDWDASGMEGW